MGVLSIGLVVLGLAVVVGCAEPVDRQEAPETTTPAESASPLPTVLAPAITTVTPPRPPSLIATPTVTPVPTESPTTTPRAPATATAPAVPTATVSAPQTATATAAPPPTQTPLRVPTATAVPTATPTPPPLSLDVRGPADGSSVPSDAVVVHGSTSPGAAVTINGAAVSVAADGEFTAEVALSPGDNTIEVVAADASGARESLVLTVVSLVAPPQPFILVITEPRDQSIVSEATIRLSDLTGTDAIVTVQGVGITVDAVGVFSTTIALDQGPNVIDVVATDADGRVLSAVIAIIYRP